MKYHLTKYLLISFLLSGCAIQQVYYVSPFNGNNTSYHAIPLKSDSVRSATYLSGAVYAGSANTHSADKVYALEGNIYNCNLFGKFQAYYGIDAVAGIYNVAVIDGTVYHPIQNYRVINSMSGDQFFGGIGLQGGINVVVPFRRVEWRAIGIEMSSHKEFGSFLLFGFSQ